MKRVVDEQRLGFVATVCPDGTANLSPKGSIAVWDDAHLVFLDFRSPGTIGNLKTNPSVEVNVVDPIRRKGYRFKGQGSVLSGGELFERVLDFFERDRGVRRNRPGCRPHSCRGCGSVDLSDLRPRRLRGRSVC